MAQIFIGCDRDQSFLMPPDVREWLPDGHLAWFVLEAVSGMDLREFYGAYREDGVGRRAYDPAMMVALLLYAYARGIRSARKIERACEEDVACKTIAMLETPDHATIARFVDRHEAALAGLFGQVLGLCADAGLVRPGVVAIDGTRMAGNASRESTLRFEEIAREILAEAKAIDEAEDELYGDQRGDELAQRLEDERDAVIAANEAYEDYRATGRDTTGRRLGRRPKPWVASAVPDGVVSVTDPDTQRIKANLGYVQGYNAQAVVDEGQIVLAAEITNTPGDFSNLDPMITATLAELERVGIAERPQVALADAQYWNEQHMDEVIARKHIQVLVRPDSSGRTAPRPGWTGGRYTWMRTVLAAEHGKGLYRKRMQMIEPVFGHTKHNRLITRFHRRGRVAVRTEWRLLMTTHNLAKLHRHQLATVGA
jgi:transposase